MDLCPNAGSLEFTPLGDGVSEVAFRLPSSQTIIMGEQLVQGRYAVVEVYSNLRSSGYKAQNTPLYNHIPSLLITWSLLVPSSSL